MKESDDVANLFARFSGEKPQYREMYDTDQQRETRERWPLFKQVGVGFAAQAPVPTFAGKEQAAGHETDETSRMGDHHMPPQSSNEGGHSLRALFDRLENVQEAVSVVEPLAPSRLGQDSGFIQSLFDRLRRS